jgi:[acyl-carrier-protein] S-malonyltransferase
MTQSSFAWVFPGQGSQVVGMGQDLAEVYLAARAVFEEADELLGWSLSSLCFNGPKEELDDTINAQPALLTASIAALRALQTEDRLPEPAFVAGHSMGEYTALVAADAMSFTDGLRLVRERGRLMKLAGERAPGRMAAVIGLADDVVEDVCAGMNGVQVANYNSPGQVVISGTREAVEAASEALRERGARRVIPLAVSIASHSELMASIAEEFAQVVENTPLWPPRVPLVANVTGEPLTDVGQIRQELVRQLTSSVQWVRSVRRMSEAGVSSFLEIGPGKVLAGLIRRINPGASTASLGTVESIRSWSV